MPGVQQRLSHGPSQAGVALSARNGTVRRGAGLAGLLALLGGAALLTLWPSADRVGAQTAATLEGVRLELYPSRDPGAVWTFTADTVTNDPVKGETKLSGLGVGERLLRERGPDGQFTGTERLDARLTAQGITIDSQDDLMMPQAKLQLVKECADITLYSGVGEPVRIRQGYGFSAPKATVSSASMSAEIEPLAMDYDSNILQDGRQHWLGDLDAPEICLDGKRVPAPASTPPA